MELNALVNLLCDALGALAIGWREGCIVAKGATAPRDGAVTIGATESRIDGDLLHTVAKGALEIARIAIETPPITPRIYLLLLLHYYSECSRPLGHNSLNRTLPHTNLEIIIKKTPLAP